MWDKYSAWLYKDILISEVISKPDNHAFVILMILKDKVYGSQPIPSVIGFSLIHKSKNLICRALFLSAVKELRSLK